VRMTIVIRVLGALLLLGAAALARNEARLARAEAAAWQQLVTLRYDAASSVDMPGGRMLASAFGDAVDTPRLQATVEYWLGRYDDLVEEQGGATNPDVLFVAANAAFRAARREQAVGPDAARQLDPVLRTYAGVLRAAPRHADAAYNLEYVARLRNRLAGMKPLPAAKGRDVPRGAGPIQTTDLPRGPTVHGLPGGPPPELKTEEFEVLTPRGFEDREADPEQAPGGRVRRKG
jgi:hypothetical protein